MVDPVTAVEPVPIRLMTQAEFLDWNRRSRTDAEYAVQARVAAPFARLDGGFRWTCPDCGRPHYAQIADEPVSGWDEPRWVLSGPADRPSAVPSLGCGLMRSEPGHHWWLRDGRMVPA